MKRQLIMILLNILGVIYIEGCTIEAPPECISGHQKCEIGALFSQGIVSVCGTDNQYHQYMCPGVCNSEGTDCDSADDMPVCQTDGEQKCEDTQLVSIEFTCMGKKWMPSLCAPGSLCSGDQCVSAKECTNGTQYCLNVSELNASISVVCKNQQWISVFCPSGVSCDGDSCGKKDVEVSCEGDSCGEKEEDVTRCGIQAVDCSSSVTGWKNGVCRNGSCEVSACMDGYHLYDGSCEKNSEMHCGSHDKKCIYTTSIENSSSVTCNREAGKCEAIRCESGYHVYDGICEKNDNTNCGVHGSLCTTNMFTGSEAVSCDTGTCVIKECSSEYIKMGNSCLERECEENSEKCIDGDDRVGRMYKCENNEWILQNKCTSNHSCLNDLTCGVCRNTYKDCVNDSATKVGTIYECISGNWKYESSCINRSCYSGSGCGSCLNGTIKCQTNAHGADKYKTCNYGSYTPRETDCAIPESITMTNVYAACIDETSCGDYKCIQPHATTVNKSDCQATGCEDGYLLCDGMCVDAQNDNDYCGDCHTACTEPSMCVGGICMGESTCGDGKSYRTITVVEPDTLDEITVEAFCINSVATFNRVRNAINNEESYPSDNHDNAYVLVTDLLLDTESFVPIGDNLHPFIGYFFGDNHLIDLDSHGGEMVKSRSYFGLFGFVENSYIDGINLEIDVRNNKTNAFIGAIAGMITDSVVTNVTVHPFFFIINADSSYIGGAFGFVSRSKLENIKVVNASIDNVTIDYHLSFVGGIVGVLSAGSSLKNSSFNGVISGNINTVGGLVGGFSGELISNSIASGVIDTSGVMAGGLVAQLTNSARIESSLSLLRVESGYQGSAYPTNYATGGGIGYLGDGVVINSGSTGRVDGGVKIGGFVGKYDAGEIINCYSLGTVSCGSCTFMGSFIHEVTHTTENSASIQNSYYNNAFNVVIGNGQDYVIPQPLDLNPVVIQQSGDTYYIKDQNGKALAEALGDQWSTKTCRIDIGDGKKDYVIPVSTSTVPDVCQ